MNVLITGGRDFSDRDNLFSVLDKLHEEYSFTLLIHGDAPGADRLSGEWAEKVGIDILATPAEWQKYGRAAGMIRNRSMLELKPDLVVAFPGGRGTAHMVKLAIKAGLKVVMANEIG